MGAARVAAASRGTERSSAGVTDAAGAARAGAGSPAGLGLADVPDWLTSEDAGVGFASARLRSADALKPCANMSSAEAAATVVSRSGSVDGLAAGAADDDFAAGAGDAIGGDAGVGTAGRAGAACWGLADGGVASCRSLLKLGIKPGRVSGAESFARDGGLAGGGGDVPARSPDAAADAGRGGSEGTRAAGDGADFGAAGLLSGVAGIAAMTSGADGRGPVASVSVELGAGAASVIRRPNAGAAGEASDVARPGISCRDGTIAPRSPAARVPSGAGGEGASNVGSRRPPATPDAVEEAGGNGSDNRGSARDAGVATGAAVLDTLPPNPGSSRRRSLGNGIPLLRAVEASRNESDAGERGSADPASVADGPAV